MRSLAYSSVLVLGVLVTLGGCAKPPRPGTDATTVGSISALPSPPGAASTAALPTGPLTIEGAAQRAVAWHPSIQQAVAKVNQQTTGISAAESAYWPQISWGVDGAFGNGSTSGNPSLNVSGTHTLYDFGKTESHVQLATAATDHSRAALTLAVDKIAYDTTLALIEVRRHRALLAIAQDRAKDVGSIVALVRQRTEQGASTQSDMLQAETRAQAAASGALQIESELKRWEAIAVSLTGTQPPLRLSGNMPGWLNVACAPTANVETSPAYLEAVASRAVAVAELEQIEAEAMPSLELRGQVGTDLTLLGHGAPDYRIGLNVGGSFNSFGANAARVEGAQYAVAAADAAIALAKLDAQRGMAEAGAQHATLSRLQRTLQQSQGTLDQTRGLYRTQYTELGTRSLLDLLNAEDEYHTARHEAASIGYDINKLSLDCARNAGNLPQSLGIEAPRVVASR